MSEVKANKISPATSTVVTLGDSSDTFVVATGAKIDINGTELILDADADTSITADTDDQIDIKIAGSDQIKFAAGEVAFNDASGDIDFRVESNGQANMFFVDGGANTVGIGTGSPKRHLHINNSASATTKIQITNAATGAATDGDGFQLGISNDGTAGIEQRENLDLTFSTNNTERMRIDSAGPVTMPSQPCVFVSLASTLTNFSINTEHEIAWGTEVFDVGGDMSGSTFTAPVTGKYLMNYNIRVNDMDSAATRFYMTLAASNRHYYIVHHMSGWAADVEHLTFAGSWIVDMDTSDTFFMRIYQAGGTAQSDLPGDTHQFLTIALLN